MILIKNKTLQILVIIALMVVSCKDITDTDLANKQVYITAPIDNLHTADSINTFIWEPVNGATKYQFQVVSPRFDSAVTFIVDSSLSRESITYKLRTGSYQWRIRAINNSSQSAYFTRNITIQ